MELGDKIKLLRASGVKKFKDETIEIEFEAAPLADPKPVEPVYPPGMPAELKNPDLMSEDVIRNWSGSPDPGDGEALPMTGDAPIDGV